MQKSEFKKLVAAIETLDLTDEARKNIEGEFAYLPSGITHYEVKGEGEPVVLVHGYATPYYLYNKLFKAFTEKGYRVLRYDLLGRGYSERVEGEYTPELFATQLNDIATHVFGEEKFHLVGTSMGGIITTTFCKMFPGKVIDLSLLAPAGMDSFKPPFYMKLSAVKGIGDFIFNMIAGKTLLKNCAAEMKYSLAEKDFYETKFADAAKYKGFVKATLSSLRNTILRTDKGVEGYKSVAEQKIPLLVIWGTDDKTMPYYQHERLVELCPDVKLVTYEGSGHIFLYDEGERTSNDVLNFWQAEFFN